MNLELETAKKLLKINAVKLQPENPFTWASGMKSPIYCDNRLTLSHPEVRNFIKESLVAKSANFEIFNAISGVATAGIAHGALLADRLNLPFSYVRSKSKEHGRQNQIEGEIAKGSKILVVEDLISTGGSSIDAVKTLRNAGHTVVGVIAIFNYEFPIAIENFKNENCIFHTLSNYSSLLSLFNSDNKLSEEEYQALKDWKKDPVLWASNFNNKIN
jgi:orotate phosphoribosyltransferase